MFLEKIIDAKRLFKDQFTPQYWEHKKPSGYLTIDQNGCVISLINADKDDKLVLGPQPYSPRSSNTSPIPLLDNSQYILGIHDVNKFNSHHELIKQINNDLEQYQLDIILKFLSNETEIAKAQELVYEKADKLKPRREPRQYVIELKIEGASSVFTDELIEYWSNYCQRQQALDNTIRVCSLCNNIGPISTTHPIKIKNKATLVSVNTDSTRSYGVKDSSQSSICCNCAYDYATIINLMLKDPEHSYQFPDSDKYAIWWTKEPDEWFQNQVRKLIGIPLKDGSKSALTIDANEFYLAILNIPKNGRAHIVSWSNKPLKQIVDNIDEYVQCQELVGSPFREPLNLFSLLYTIFSGDIYKKERFRFASELFLDVIEGRPFPDVLSYHLLNKWENLYFKDANGGLNYKLIVFTKLFMNLKKGDIIKMGLDKESRNPGYLQGRLFAVYEKIQAAAMDYHVNAGIDKKYFATAMKFPGRIFGELIELNNHHLAKLGGKKRYLKDYLLEIMDNVSDFPARNTQQDRLMFGIGYYHQQSQMQKDMEEYKNKEEEDE
jgi:CRISPR-associated protein Csd1